MGLHARTIHVTGAKGARRLAVLTIKAVVTRLLKQKIGVDDLLISCINI